MKKWLLLVLPLFLTSIVSGIDSSAPPIAYCQHMGYSIFPEISKDKGPLCLFDSNNYCTAYDFYMGECGKDRVREFPLRGEGQIVFPEFERCEPGLIPSEKQFLLDNQICSKPINLITLFNFLSLFY